MQLTERALDVTDFHEHTIIYINQNKCNINTDKSKYKIVSIEPHRHNLFY